MFFQFSQGRPVSVSPGNYWYGGRLLSLLVGVTYLHLMIFPAALAFVSAPSQHSQHSLQWSQRSILSSARVRTFQAASGTSGYDSDVEYSSSLFRSRRGSEKRQIFEEEGGETLYRGKGLIRRLFLRPMKRLSRTLFPRTGTPEPGTLILVRGGEHEWASNYTFTGWADPRISRRGKKECGHAGRLLLEAGYEPDIVYTSRLRRSIDSAWIISQEVGAVFLPMFKSWRLNERNYGALTGLCKKRTADELGTDQVLSWRQSLDDRPPALQRDDPRHPGNDRKYEDLSEVELPATESVRDAMERIAPLWKYRIQRDLSNGNNVMVCAHGNTLRGLIKIIDGIDDGDIQSVSMPTGIPFVYRFARGTMVPVPPKPGSLTQEHTSGVFLEKPGLLKTALEEEEKFLEISTSGNDGDDMSNSDVEISRQITALEKSLTTLREEREMEAKVGQWENQFTKKKDFIANQEIKLQLVDRALDTESGDLNLDTVIEKETPAMAEQFELNPNINKIDNTRDNFVVFIRHGRTPHNQLKLFTGWEDPPLLPEGVYDAREGGRLLRKHGFEFDVVYTSWLGRAIQTAYYVMDELDCLWLPMIKSWRLNERHYGALTGKSKKMVGNIYGEEKLKNWRKGFDTPPPTCSSYSKDYPGNDHRLEKYVKDMRFSFKESLFRSIQDGRFRLHRKFPKSESLKMCMDRSIPFYTDKIVPEAVARGKRVLVVSHENAIRGILMHLCDIPEEYMTDLNLPNGVPLVYNVKRRCISLLEDGSGREPHNFGSATQFLFRPCELTDEDFEFPEEKGDEMRANVDDSTLVV